MDTAPTNENRAGKRFADIKKLLKDRGRTLVDRAGEVKSMGFIGRVGAYQKNLLPLENRGPDRGDLDE